MLLLLACTAPPVPDTGDSDTEPACPAYSGLRVDGRELDWEVHDEPTSPGVEAGTWTTTVIDHGQGFWERRMSGQVSGEQDAQVEGYDQFRCDDEGVWMLASSRTVLLATRTTETLFEYTDPPLVVPAGMAVGDDWTAPATVIVWVDGTPDPPLDESWRGEVLGEYVLGLPFGGVLGLDVRLNGHSQLMHEDLGVVRDHDAVLMDWRDP